MQESQWAGSSSQAPNGAPEVYILFKPASISTNYRPKPKSREDPSIDEFAQTRQPDDLFDDDYTPITEPINQIVPPTAPRSSYPQPRARGSQARGRGRRGFPRSADNAHHAHPTSKSTPNPASTSTVIATAPDSATSAEAPASTAPADPANVIAAADATNPAPKSSPVRGSRLQTGGVQKPKLTESELSARLAAARLNNAKREEAHRLAEADEASFQHREAQAREKRREEGAARRVMEGERESNRLRKLGARGGREWDEGKAPEEEKVRGARRGMYGGVVGGGSGGRGRGGEAGYAGRGGDSPGEDNIENPSGRGSFEGRRGRGRGRGDRGRGRGRGDFGGDGTGDHVGRGQQGFKKPAAFKETDFPALAVDVTKNAGSLPAERIVTLDNKDILKSPTGERGTWADQVEAGTAGS
ncbi:hypothetical protein MMC26_001748 [Xylographa opegraphella]|nr:hypothetical protein [Xylographa opegraphella]